MSKVYGKFTTSCTAQGRIRGVGSTLTLVRQIPSLPFPPSYPLPSSPFVVVWPSFFPPLSILPLPSIFASLPLEVGGLNPSRGSGAEPQRKSNLVHFSIKIWHLVAQILLESTHVLENWYNANIKILACQITGPAAAGSTGSVPTALCIKSKAEN